MILAGAWIAGSLVREFIEAYDRPYVYSTDTDSDEPILGLVDLTTAYLINILGIPTALHALDMKITGFLASLGIAGPAAALAAQTILSYLFGGLILIPGRYIRREHRVPVGESVGNGEEITRYKTALRTRDNLLISIPNDVLMHETTVNYSRPSGFVERLA